LSLLHALGIFAAGAAAGAINVIVGSGTLITFPTLLAFGYAPVVANVSNTIGLVPGRSPAPSATGASCAARCAPAQARRRDGARSRRRATLLLTLPASAFKAIVPAFIALALVLIIVQPRLSVLLRRTAATPTSRSARRRCSASARPASTPAISAPPRGS